MRLILLLSLLFPFLSLADDGPQQAAKQIVDNLEQVTAEGKDQFVLVSFINGSMEIVATVKPSKDWDDAYRKGLEAKIVLTILRGANMFKLLVIKKGEEVLV